MPKGPGYTLNDLAYWTGLIAGAGTTHVVLMNLPAYHDLLDKLDLLAWTRPVTLVLSLVVGVALGAACERTLRSYQEGKKAKKVDESDHYDDYRDNHGEPRR